MTAPFNITRSVLGQPWAWRGGMLPDPGAGAASGLSDVVHQLFRARGAVSGDIDRLLSARVRDWLPDPSIFRDMDLAAARLAKAITARQKIVIFGDYDVDGATSAALLVRVVRQCGGVCSAYIPDRLLEGYGPSADAMAALKAAGAELVVTVDCGTQGFAALGRAQAEGLDVIVVDHHQASTALPPACAVVNPNRLDEGAEARQFGHLAAVGMAFLTGVAVVRTLRGQGWFGDGHGARAEPKLLDLLDLVALGTVADVVPLTGLNRAFVAQGLKVMAARRNPGLSALIDIAGIERAPVAKDLGFALGPRINAGGRVGKSDLGVRLLICDDPGEAAALAAELDRLNIERKVVESEVTDEAVLRAAGCVNEAVAVVSGDGWHAGVIGIVASRLKDRFKRPAIVIALDGGVGKGSGRSLPGVDLGGAVLAAKDHGLLIAGGGHPMACGLTIDTARIPAFTAFLHERLSGDIDRAQGGASLLCDAALSPRGICVDLAETLDGAGPYGQGWPAPRIAAGPWTVVKCDVVGGAHVRVILMGADGARLKAMAFRHADTPLGAALAGTSGRAIYIAGRVQRDDWGREPAAELHIDDIAYADGF